MQITQAPSPNHSSRAGHPIRLIVMHSTAGSYSSSLGWLRNPASKASAHYLIDRDGAVVQLVADSEAAWHAGASQWRGQEVWARNSQGILVPSLNPISIGIELANATGVAYDPASGKPKPYPEWPQPQPYPTPQLVAATMLVHDLMARYHLSRDDVVRHLDVAVPRGRKHDPVSFDWADWWGRL